MAIFYSAGALWPSTCGFWLLNEDPPIVAASAAGRQASRGENLLRTARDLAVYMVEVIVAETDLSRGHTLQLAPRRKQQRKLLVQNSYQTPTKLLRNPYQTPPKTPNPYQTLTKPLPNSQTYPKLTGFWLVWRFVAFFLCAHMRTVFSRFFRCALVVVQLSGGRIRFSQ